MSVCEVSYPLLMAFLDDACHNAALQFPASRLSVGMELGGTQA